MARLNFLLILLGCIAISLAEPGFPVDELKSRIFLKNVYQHRYLIFDPLSADFEPRALIWNLPDVIPPKGGAWFYLAKSPVAQEDNHDFNLVGGRHTNFTLCVSLLQPDRDNSLHYVHGYLDFDHLDAPECRWRLRKCWDGENYWLINKLYDGHLKEGADKYNVDPLRRSVFLETKESETDEREMWQMGEVLEPNDQNDQERTVPAEDYD